MNGLILLCSRWLKISTAQVLV